MDWVNELLAKVTKMWTKYVFVCHFDQVILLLCIKMQYFVGADFP